MSCKMTYHNLLMGRVARRCLLALSLGIFFAAESFAAGIPFTSATFSTAGTTFDDTTILTSYTTASGTVSTLSHAVSAQGNFDLVTGTVSEVVNVWGVIGGEVDGVAAALNLDVSIGVANAGDNNDITTTDVGETGSTLAQFLFSQEITATISGAGNDFFLVELDGNDALTVVPLDSSGNPITTFSLPIFKKTSPTPSWGSLGAGVARILQNSTSTGTSALWGTAFDFGDFEDENGATLSDLSLGMWGIGFSGTTGLDAMIVGVNSQLAPVPEPASLMLLGMAGVSVMLLDFRRGKRRSK